MNAKITIGAFDIYVNVINRTFSIGTMVIEDMECTQDADGFYSFSKSDTECQAGDYLAKINNIISGLLSTHDELLASEAFNFEAHRCVYISNKE